MDLEAQRDVYPKFKLNGTELPFSNPIEIYTAYIEAVDAIRTSEREANLGSTFVGSMAGMCIKKHWYFRNSQERAHISDTDRRLLRLGSIVGKDIEDSHHWWRDNINGDSEIGIYTEELVVSKTYNVEGHFDLLFVIKSSSGRRLGYLFDHKTSNSWKFKRLFGRNPDESPSTNYEHQLGTYAMCLEEEGLLCDEIVYMANIYMNKDNSVMKIKEAPIDYIEFARRYWDRVNKWTEEEPEYGVKVPVYPWECGKYCSYRHVCDSPLLKEDFK